MSDTFVQPRLFPETEEWHAALVYWSEQTLYLVQLGPDGPIVGEEVGDLSITQARSVLRPDREAEDPYDLILAARAMVG